MRIATLIIGLVLVVGMFLQSAVVGGLSEAAGDQGSSSAAAVGVLMSLIWVFGCALVIPLPRIAMALFALAGALGFAAAAEFPDLGIWGVISLVLALFSFFGWRGKRRADRRERERDDLVRRAAQAQLATAGATSFMARGLGAASAPALGPAAGPACRACGAGSATGSRFCGTCGTALVAAATP